MRTPCLIMALLAAFPAVAQQQQQPVDTIPFGGNSWFHSGKGTTIWFRVSHPVTLKLRLLATGSRDTAIDLGSLTIRDTGYQHVTVPPTSLRLQSLIAAGGSAAGRLNYVPNDIGNFFYWGRRGPSVHLNYAIPDSIPVKWFYNEVTVPKGQDRVGSFFMADGFSVGYFGMQVNSSSERRILFSVWSPFPTDDPKAIPDSLRIGLIRKGAGVHAGTFGAEGAGGQSFLVFPWVAGHTYRFLICAGPGPEPPRANHTRFTAWFYAPETGHWLLIASWDRPATHTWLTHLHSFLENFDPETGDQERSALYTNQWVADSAGHWHAITRARFTGDNTARKGYRLDYAGGEKGPSAFYLRNGGFFNDYTPLDTWFDRPIGRQQNPAVDLASPFFR